MASQERSEQSTSETLDPRIQEVIQLPLNNFVFDPELADLVSKGVMTEEEAAYQVAIENELDLKIKR